MFNSAVVWFDLFFTFDLFFNVGLNSFNVVICIFRIKCVTLILYYMNHALLNIQFCWKIFVDISLSKYWHVPNNFAAFKIVKYSRISRSNCIWSWNWVFFFLFFQNLKIHPHHFDRQVFSWLFLNTKFEF